MSHRITIAVAALILILAVFQYRWISQVSEGERIRLRAAVNGGVARVAQEFNGEITRAFVSLQMGRPDSAMEETSQRVAGWMSSSPYRRIIRGLYRTRGGKDGLSEILRFNPSTEQFEATTWPVSLAELRGRLMSRLKGLPNGGPPMTVEEDVPAIVGRRPSGPPFTDPDVVSGWSIAEIDLDFVQRELLPQLIAKNFSVDYEVAVVRRSDPTQLISGASALTNPDASAYLLEVRPGNFLMQAGLRGFGGGRGLGLGPGRGGRPGQPARPADEQPEGGPEMLAGPPGNPAAALRAEPGPWQLVARHRLGSVEAAADQMRLRDLAIGFALLVLLAAATAVLGVSARRAQKLAHQQMEFVAGVSHELRTPLTVISSAADNLADGVVAGEAQTKRYGAVIRQESRRLIDMVEQVLRFSGLQSGRAQYKVGPVDVAPAVERALANIRPEIRDSGMELHLEIQEGLPPVLADAAALVHCLGNLVSNAVKHARDGRWIGIEARLSGMGEAAVEIEVSDRGPGIDPADAAHLFEPFYRGRRAVSDQIKGAGLGLSLVKRIVEAQSGTVKVTSQPGQGAKFTIRLPLATREDA
jgi:signal transduction histidine kinase